MASLYQRNKKVILAKEEICAICGQYVDKTIKTPHPESAEVDHIIPKNKGGTDSLNNLQLSHRKCNRAKSDNLNYIHVEKKECKKFEQLVNFE
ncbi:HNH endonuclease [Erysipelotrichaceae bacterium OttesenSCG-928-M19]|nr:HNH endonuclease [Erysipelotrichaceae bacterium OttesenSCG-928-M19]